MVKRNRQRLFCTEYIFLCVKAAAVDGDFPGCYNYIHIEAAVRIAGFRFGTQREAGDRYRLL